MDFKVKEFVRFRGSWYADIANGLGFLKHHLVEVISCKKRSRWVESYIAQVVGVKRAKLFGREEGSKRDHRSIE